MNKRSSCHFSAFGRVVLSGEHSVVYGYPALVSSLDLGVEARFTDQIHIDDAYVTALKQFFINRYQVPNKTLSIVIESQIPIGAGLSSSTAVASAVFQLLANYFQVELNSERLFELLVAFESQNYPVSGMDQTAVVYGGLMQFQKKAEKCWFDQLHAPCLKQLDFYLISSGIPEENTKEMVALVKQRISSNPDQTNQILAEIGFCTKQTLRMLQKSLFEPEILKENHQWLCQLGVVGDHAKQMINLIQDSGGFAKISGAGGVRSGSGILLAYHPDLEKLQHLINQKEWNHWKIKLGE